MSQEASDFITIASLTTFSGAATATWAVSALIGKLFNRNSNWLSFVIAAVVSFLIAGHQNLLGTPLEWFLVMVNAAMLFFAAAGLNEAVVTGATPRPAGETKPQGGEKIRFLRSWFR